MWNKEGGSGWVFGGIIFGCAGFALIREGVLGWDESDGMDGMSGSTRC